MMPKPKLDTKQDRETVSIGNGKSKKWWPKCRPNLGSKIQAYKAPEIG